MADNCTLANYPPDLTKFLDGQECEIDEDANWDWEEGDTDEMGHPYIKPKHKYHISFETHEYNIELNSVPAEHIERRENQTS